MFSWFKKKVPEPQIESEPWVRGDDQLTITYKQGARPDDSIIDQIKVDIGRYEKMILDRINQTGEYKEDIKVGLTLEGVSFPVYDCEQGDYDFSVDYALGTDGESFLLAYFKDGKIQSLSAGD